MDMGKHRELFQDLLISILFGCILILLMRQFGAILYTQDSTPYFLYPFSQSNNPFTSFQSHGGELTFFFQPYNIFLDLLLYSLQHIGLSIGWSETAWIFITIFISNLGLLWMLRILSPNRVRPNLFAQVTAIALFWLNPFSISVTLWHLLSWFIFQAMLPFVFVVAFLILEGDLKNHKIYFSLAILMFYSPGFYGPYSVVVSTIYALVLIFLALRLVLNRDIRAFLVRLGMLSFSLTVNIYFSLSFILITHATRTLSLNFLTGGTGSQTELIQLLRYESISTSFWHVLTLTGFLWLYDGRGAVAYVWFSQFWILLIGAVFVPLIFSTGSLASKGEYSTKLKFLYAMSFVSIVISVGSNAPFGALNTFLLLLGGPFLVVSNGYYFLMQIYVLTITSVSYVMLTMPSKSFSRTIKKMGQHLYQLVHRSNRTLSYNVRKKAYLSVAVSIFSIIVIVTSTIPLATSGSVMNHGPLEDSFNLPSSFTRLHDFFHEMVGDMNRLPPA